MEGYNPYLGLRRDELLKEIEEVKSIVYAGEALHEDPVEDLAIRGIWSALLVPLLEQLKALDSYSGAA